MGGSVTGYSVASGVGSCSLYLLGPSLEGRVKSIATSLGKVLKPVTSDRLRSGGEGNAESQQAGRDEACLDHDCTLFKEGGIVGVEWVWWGVLVQRR